MEFRLLGPLEVIAGGSALGIEAHKPRSLLALLLLDANEIVPVDSLIDRLWDGAPPASAAKLLQTYVSQLRKALGPERIATRSPGYLIRVEPDELDVERFERLRATSPHDALVLWRGDPLAEFAYDAWAQPEIARLEEVWLETVEERIDLDLELGRHAEIVAELDALAHEHPLRERLRRQLMLALYRCGRQAEALAVYREGRRLLIDELGIEPSALLQQLERAILRQDPELEPTPRARAAEPERLIGRETVLDEIAALLRSARLTTLTGPGGVGKTRLALEASIRAAARYADGVVIVELGAVVDPDLVATEAARALSLAETPRSSAADALAAYLRGKHLLLVLDNFEQVANAVPLLDDLLTAAPGLSLLVTSRVPLHLVAEARYPVPPLELPDPSALPPLETLAATESVALFVGRARASRPEFDLRAENAAAVAQLCVRLDGLPLALELAGARVNLLSPNAILNRLGRRLDLLKATDTAGPERHRTLRAAIEWSYDLLAPSEQALFTSLAVFAGGFTVDGAEAVAGGDVLEGLGTLLDSSLVRAERAVADEPRFGMLETIREYALERLAARDDEQELAQRHAAFYSGLADLAEPALRGRDQVTWLRRLDAERENLRAALSWSADRGEAELGLRAATGLWRYWQVRGGVGEGRARLERLLAKGGPVSTPVRAGALAAAGRLAFMHGDLEPAAALLQESLALQPASAGGPMAMSLTVLAGIALAHGDLPRAEQLFDEALAAARAAGDWFGQALALSGRGDLLYAAGKPNEARRSLEEGVRAAREVGDTRNIARCLTSLGGVALEQHDYERATRLLEEALAAQRELGDRWGIPRSLVSLGVAALGRGDRDAAQALFEQGLVLQLEADDRPGIAATLERTAALNAEAGDHERAATLYGAAAILREMVGAHPFQLVHHENTEAIEALTAALDPEVFADAWSHGRAMTVDDAVSYALDQTRRENDARHALS